MTATDCAHEFVDALAAQDFEQLAALLTPDVQFHAVVPVSGSFREEATAGSTGARFASWFGDADPLELISSRIEQLPAAVRIDYRFAA